MDREILVQYCDLKEEAADLRRRIERLDEFLEHPPIVADVVRGTRRDGTIGPIKITGIPDPEYARKQRMRERYEHLLEAKEIELLEMTCQADEYIESIDKAELRIMLRLYIIDGYNYAATARRMNGMFPNRQTKYTDENIKKRIQRLFEKI